MLLRQLAALADQADDAAENSMADLICDGSKVQASTALGGLFGR